MRKKIHFLLVFILSVGFSYGQSKLWTKVSEEKLGDLEKMERASVPSVYQIMHLDLNAFKQSLVGAPVDTEGAFSNTIVNFPNSKGELSRFRVYEAPIMEKGLADRYPDIKSYAAVGVDNPSVKLRFSVTLFGLHVMSTSGDEGTYYIDTYTKDLNNYIVYNRKDLYTVRTFACHFQDNHEEIAEQNRSAVENQTLATDGKFRQYRLAMACTIEYAAFHVTAAGLGAGTLAQKKAAVLSAMNVTMTRVNGIYERDMSLRMNLVANNDLVIFIDSDNFSNDDAGNLIGESQTEITAIIGSANFDIGHTVSTGGGGLAGLGVVCNSANKARGITGSPSPVGDPYDIDYVAHEMGHQFGGPHTFSSNDDTAGNCDSGNVSSANAVEPGSGSTIMAYAGICEENVQSNSDAYFHAVSIASMNAVMIGSGNCAPQTNNGNNPPVIAALSNYTIPKGTAFVLTGNATDANAGASLTYCWEQTNAAAGTNFPTSTQTTGPVYRSLNPSTSNKRYFPNFQSVLSGDLAPTWEVTPTVGRTLNFALTVRDNQTPTGGQTARANMTVTTVGAAGPFVVTSPTLNASYDTGSTQTITWDVAGTNANGINTSNVNILISTDGGVTFSTLLANTANDGNQAVTMPSVAAPFCRIIVEAVGNIYYAVSPSFSIGYTVTQTTVCTDYSRTFSTPAAMTTGWSAYGIPGPGIAITDDYIITDVDFKVVSTAARTNQVSFGLVKPGSSVVDVVVFDGPTSGCTNSRVNLNAIFDDEGAAFNCNATATGQRYIPTTSLSSLDGISSAGIWRFAAKSTLTTNTISSVVLTLCRLDTVVTLNSDSFGLQNFTLYPNPNNGNFNIQFTSTSSDEIKVNVHDIRGREIYSKSYTNNGLFNENLQLSNVQSGVYLVTVQDGARKEVKKIVVQ